VPRPPLQNSPRRVGAERSKATFVRLVAFLAILWLGGLCGVNTIRIFRPLEPDLAEGADDVDAVVVFAGGRGERRAHTFDLYRRHFSSTLNPPTLVFSIGNGMLPHVDVSERCARFAQQAWAEIGPVPVKCFAPDPATTAGEASAVAALASDHQWSNVVGVSSDYHAHRVGIWLQRCLTPIGVTTQVAPAPANRRFQLVEHEFFGALYAQVADLRCPTRSRPTNETVSHHRSTLAPYKLDTYEFGISRATRNPMLPVVDSGVLELRASTR